MSEKIVKIILDDAQKKAVSTRNEGNAKAQEIISRANRDVTISKQDAYQETQNTRDNILKQGVTNGNLEVKKMILSAKHEVLDKTFARAIEKIQALPSRKYLDLISSILEYAEDGDVVRIRKEDAKVITKAFIEAQSKKLKRKISLSSEYIDITGGIMLSNESYDKNLSLDILMQSLREELETEISNKLFS